MSLLIKSLFVFKINKLKPVSSSLTKLYSSNAAIPQFETLAVSVPKDKVFHVELNRPKQINIFNDNMWNELKDCFTSLSDNPECRVIILSGRGKHFTGGIDFNSLMEQGQKALQFDDIARRSRVLNRLIERYQNGITALEVCEKPILAVVHNACVGAGVDLITAADVRYCTEEAWFQVKEVDLGLAADVGTLQRLPKVIGNTSTARELCFTARKLGAQEALQLGLVSKVFKDRESAIQQVLEIAETIASKSPVAIQMTKKSLVYSQSRPNEDGLEHIKLINQLMLQSEDLTKGAMALATKTTPEYDNF